MEKNYQTKLNNVDVHYFLSTSENGDFIAMITLFSFLDYYQLVDNHWILKSRQGKLLDKWNLRVFQLSMDGKKFAYLTENFGIQHYMYSENKKRWILTRKHQLTDWHLLKSRPYIFYGNSTLDFWFTNSTLEILEDQFEVYLYSNIYKSKRLKRYIIQGNECVCNSRFKLIATQIKRKIYIYKFYSDLVFAVFHIKHKISGFCIKDDTNLLIHCQNKILFFSLKKKEQLFEIDISMIKINTDQTQLVASKGIIIMQCQKIIYFLYLNEKEKEIIKVKPLNLISNNFFTCSTGGMYIIQEQNPKDCYKFNYYIYSIK